MTGQMTAKLVDCMASDDMVVQAAQVSVKGENNPGTDVSRLINYLMQHRHGSPFEHAYFKLFVEAPIFVFREWQRHRMASYNEISGRYTKLIPKFYTYPDDRPMVNVGTSARPKMAPADPKVVGLIQDGDYAIARQSWGFYEERLQAGVANEVARSVLPVSVYSQMYCTINARSLMNFISLRTEDQGATYISHPQWEIEQLGRQVERIFSEQMPATWRAFHLNGRMAP